jgi:sterol desaturase/sphingolipid hydroxylase (fatty acid hydroxylase superfamily)
MLRTLLDLTTSLSNPALSRITSSGLFKSLVGFGVLCALFWTLESLWPEDRTQPKWRRGSFTDTLYFFVLIPIAKFLSTVAIVIAFVLTVRFIPKIAVAQLGGQPQWLQVLQVILLGNVFGYWIHRAFHRVAAL